MLDLSNISIVAICNDKYLIKTMRAMQHCLNRAAFDKALIVTNIKNQISYDSRIEFINISKQIDEITYNQFCINNLNDCVKSDFCLIIQWDGFIIDEKQWKSDFLNYDYIGAPWGFPSDCRNRVGNGGFSLRSKYFLEISSKIQYDPYHYETYTPLQLYDRKISPEDWFLCYDKFEYLQSQNIKFPTVEVASQFSVEHPNIIKHYDRVDTSTYESFGFHGSLNTGAMNLLENK